VPEELIIRHVSQKSWQFSIIIVRNDTLLHALRQKAT
jgi:hypothetical protein